MAYNGVTKAVELDSGVVLSHWKITNVQYTKDVDTLLFYLSGYVNKAAYDAGKPFVHEQEVEMLKSNNPIDFADINQKDRNILMRMYDFAKSPGQFLEGGKDVIE